MAKALCRRCQGTGEGSTFEEASSKINHAVGLGRSIPCGASYGQVVDISPKTVPTPKPAPPPQPKKATKSKDTPPKKPDLKDEIKEDIKEGVKDVVENVVKDVAKDIVEEKSQAVNE